MLGLSMKHASARSCVRRRCVPLPQRHCERHPRQSPGFPNTVPGMHAESRESFSQLFQRGLIAAQSHNLAEAAELFARAIELKREHPAAHSNRATVQTASHSSLDLGGRS
jgi:hypothetical protein